MKLWIARCWGLRLYEYKPKLFVIGDYKCISPTKGKVYEIDIDLFPEVTFENSPQEVELKLVSNKVGKGSKNLTFEEIERLIDDLI